MERSDALPFIPRKRPSAVPSRRPIFQNGVAYFRIRPRRSATGTRPPKSHKIGGMRGERAFNLPPLPCANVVQSAQKMRRDLLTRAWDAAHVVPGGEVRGFMGSVRWGARKLLGIVSNLLDRIRWAAALVWSKRAHWTSRDTWHGSADVARVRRTKDWERVELAAITSFLHLAGFELHGGRRAKSPSSSLTR